ncbi:uncharacterized protein LOC114770602 [Denticeps clupeoides]|uniref:uncharacterized protein LOC114770602 n=1 Tax=Denticeps clupeoides TaxID=299321 RepID=UPI0010A3E0C2|nr:uncharacterized protein LOC114770602 [Denticeps clupeoides]
MMNKCEGVVLEIPSGTSIKFTRPGPQGKRTKRSAMPSARHNVLLVQLLALAVALEGRSVTPVPEEESGEVSGGEEPRNAQQKVDVVNLTLALQKGVATLEKKFAEAFPEVTSEFESRSAPDGCDRGNFSRARCLPSITTGLQMFAARMQMVRREFEPELAARIISSAEHLHGGLSKMCRSGCGGAPRSPPPPPPQARASDPLWERRVAVRSALATFNTFLQGAHRALRYMARPRGRRAPH